MSRIGKLPIAIPNGVNIDLDGSLVSVKGPHGTLNYNLPEEIAMEVLDNKIIFSKKVQTRIANQKYGLARSIVNNMVIGVSKQFERHLQMVGVGYRSQVEGNNLVLNVGFSHPVKFSAPEGIKIKVEANTNITLTGIDNEQVGLLASKIRAVRPPEPYKGKGIRYANETVLRKAGKSGK